MERVAIAHSCEATVAACRADQAACTPATLQFLSIVDLGAHREGRVRLSSGAGDREDYAIVKYVALRGLGISSDDLRLILVQDEKREIGHTVVAMRHEQHWLILDNRTMAILGAEDRARLSATVCTGSERHAGICDRVGRSHHKSII
jgi:Bacterial transglutaminase-like cysteine proteinase BTLCP